MEENLAGSFHERLKTDTNPVSVLVSFYAELFSRPFDVKLIGPIARLVKLYGRDSVFYAILSIEGMEDLNHSNIYPLLRYICNKKLEERKDGQSHEDLTSYVASVKKKTEKVSKQKIKIGNPFNE